MQCRTGSLVDCQGRFKLNRVHVIPCYTSKQMMGKQYEVLFETGGFTLAGEVVEIGMLVCEGTDDTKLPLYPTGSYGLLCYRTVGYLPIAGETSGYVMVKEGRALLIFWHWLKELICNRNSYRKIDREKK